MGYRIQKEKQLKKHCVYSAPCIYIYQKNNWKGIKKRIQKEEGITGSSKGIFSDVTRRIMLKNSMLSNIKGAVCLMVSPDKVTLSIVTL